jgi:hypothetical protein
LLLVSFPRGGWPLVVIEAVELNIRREEVANARAEARGLREAEESVSMLPARSTRMKVSAAVGAVK